MNKISISLCLHCHIADVKKYGEENLYNNSLKKLAQFLFTHPNVSFSFYLNSPYINWLSNNHPEFFFLMKDLISRKQIEFLGGGYYEPIFPLILPIDRIGQIEQYTTNLRKVVGKKARGIFLGNSIWDPALISTFNSCGMDFAIINSSLFEENAQKGDVFIVEDMGKTLQVIPQYDLFENPDFTKDAQLCLENIKRKFLPSENTNENKIFFSSIPITEIDNFLENNWLENFCKMAIDSKQFNFSTPQAFLATKSDFTRIFIPAGCPKEIKKWAIKPFISVNENDNELKNSNIRNFLYTYQEISYLYARMMYTSLIINQSKGDKVRKRSMKEFLWKAQFQAPYMYLGYDGICNPKTRNSAYKNLLLAEKLVREVSPSFADSFLSFDYDLDGKKEYIIHKKIYNAFISLNGGSIIELDLIENSKNYCDTLSRVNLFDKVNDFYPKKIFIDHLIDYDHFEQFKNDSSYCNAIFSQVTYKEVVFDRVKKILSLSANALYGILQQPVSITKKYVFSDEGIKVQYILKNDGPLPLNGYFAVETNLCFSGCEKQHQLIEVIENDTKVFADSSKTFFRENAISLVQLTDICEGNVFTFEPNENAGISIQNLYITRPIENSTQKRYQATTCNFFWKVEIPPGYEVEKTLFLGIHSLPKAQN